jgi:hypothetical protein
VQIFLAGLLFATVANGQHSGALIGTVVTRAQAEQNPDSVAAPTYQTLWMGADSSGKFRVLATIPGLVVPRRDGFWHVGVKQVCEFQPSESGGNESIEQVIWAAAIGKAGEVEQERPCTPHKPDDYASPDGRTKDDKNKISQCGYTFTDIEFLSTVLISQRQYSSQSEDCDARGGHYDETYSVRRFDSKEPLSFRELLGPQAGTAYTRAIPKTARDENGEDCGAPISTTDNEWRIGRNDGRWAPFVHQSLGNFGCSVDALVRFRLPAADTGETSVISDWKAFQLKEPGLHDGFLGPSADLAILVTKEAIKVYEVLGNTPGTLLLTLPAQEIVMVRWATGSHVADWTAQLDKISKEPQPQPIVQVKPGLE